MDTKTSERLKKLVSNLKRKRLKLNLTQRELASLMGISKTSISRLERTNHASLKVVDLIKMLEIFEKVQEQKQNENI